ncbi:sulfate/molybdate ABC transporter ATP-binding protein [Knoellia subterranea]|uniref:Molybdenum ABC transporter ATP-binding protein n=1 Tax=Knoellia subterranea KCTC 19937 TaxID=1385521 RepID=A0A0A0JIU5_9MICO|nr:ATP-binding cassette domain-containing protein [Knoellia subterranea]KGN37345.1 molybdenum ABC transporter ATP-binding protein [Knoellia subterranea KCTC 19937]
MSLEVDVAVPERDVEVAFTVETGETLALLGPNGAGKSTVLAAIAGLIARSGTVRLDDMTLADESTGTHLRPHERGIALLAQEARLFPHLTAGDNVAFGPRAHGQSRRDAHTTAVRWLEEVGMTAYADRRPHELSGGQQQRVAIARALATEPRVLLVDEPLSALDVESAPEIRDLLRRVLATRTTVLVTHEVLDAALLADRVAVIDAGRIVDLGDTARVLGRPRSDFGARFAGLNLVRGVAVGEALRMPDGRLLHGLAEVPLTDGSPAAAVVAPSAVSVHLDHPHGSPRNSLAATVVDLEPHAHLVRVRTDVLSADITAAAVAELGLARGNPVVLSVKATEVHLHPA